jgi:hypothetical protein
MCFSLTCIDRRAGHDQRSRLREQNFPTYFELFEALSKR